MNKTLLVAALIALGLAACSKKEEAPVEASAPAVEASAPVEAVASEVTPAPVEAVASDASAAQ